MRLRLAPAKSLPLGPALWPASAPLESDRTELRRRAHKVLNFTGAEAAAQHILALHASEGSQTPIEPVKVPA